VVEFYGCQDLKKLWDSVTFIQKTNPTYMLNLKVLLLEKKSWSRLITI